MELDLNQAERFGRLALDCIHREYPNKIAHVLNSDQDVKPPRELTPAFFGCYDWHSAVHSHWMLVRLLRLFPQVSFAGEAGNSLRHDFTREKIAREVRYLTGEGRQAFERPYGLTWLLQLVAELKQWKTPEAQVWADVLRPLEAAVRKQLEVWLTKLSRPIRTGEHSSTAFGLCLMLDYARDSGELQLQEFLRERTLSYFSSDRNCPIEYEPSGEDFLSPCLAEADAMRRVLAPAAFAQWFSLFLDETVWQPTYTADESDGKSGHLIGLNLSRAWMLAGIAGALPSEDARRGSLLKMSTSLKEAGLNAMDSRHYHAAHWLGSFAVYLLSERFVS